MENKGAIVLGRAHICVISSLYKTLQDMVEMIEMIS